jgi:hypothetical protein
VAAGDHRRDPRRCRAAAGDLNGLPADDC